MARRHWWRCALGLHFWAWPVEIRLGGRGHAAQRCRHCPAVKWLGASRPGQSVQTG